MMDRQESIDLILDHYHRPRNRRAMDDATFSAEGVNPGCGDVVRMSVRLGADGRIADVAFEGQGCTISQAAASILTGLALGHTLDEILDMDSEIMVDALGRDVVVSRARCATLPLDVLKEGIHTHRDGASRRPVADTSGAHSHE
jgi:nitrogen fixation NifU-like protein